MSSSVHAIAMQLQYQKSETQALYEQLQQEVRRLVHSYFADPEVLALIAERWQTKLHNHQEPGTVEIVLPQALSPQEADWQQRCQQVFAQPVQIRFHEDARFLFRYHDQLAEIDPDALSDTLLLQGDIFEQLDARCQSISEQAIAQLMQAWPPE